jgi:hypothetical protein
MLILKISLIASGKSGNVKRNRLTLWYKKKEETHKTLRGADMLCFTQNPRMPRVYADKKIIVYPLKFSPFYPISILEVSLMIKKLVIILSIFSSSLLIAKSQESITPFIKKTIELVNPSLDSQSQVLSIGSIEKASKKYLKTDLIRKGFVVIVAIESKFQKGLTSHVGAIGPAQLMPHLFSYFANTCKIPVNENSIYDYETNIMVGACWFNHLVKKHSGNLLLAAAEYNGGSRAANRLKYMKNINKETANYVARFSFIMDSLGVKDAKGADIFGIFPNLSK